MLGPCGAGLFYVRKSLQAKLRPAVYGWHNIRCPNFVAQEQLVYPPDARRYEGRFGQSFGVNGTERGGGIAFGNRRRKHRGAACCRVRSWLVPALQEKGWTVLQADAPPQNASAIVSFHRAGTDLPALREKLMAEGIEISLRTDRSGRHYLRVSPHFYNTDAEIHRLLEKL